MGNGLKRLLKGFGKIEVKDNEGNSCTHVWDYANDMPRIEGEMTKEEIEASERAKWLKIKEQTKS